MLHSSEKINEPQTLSQEIPFFLRNEKKKKGGIRLLARKTAGVLFLQAQRAWQAIMRTGGSSSADRAMPKMMPKFFITSSWAVSMVRTAWVEAHTDI